MRTERLDAIEARLNASQPGPWAVMDVNDPGEGVNFIDVYAETDGLETVCRMPNPAEYSRREFLQADAEFIAHAPQDIADLLDLARKQQAALNRVAVLGEEIAEGHTLLNKVVANAITEALEG